MGNTCCCCRKKLKKNICLLLLGLDNAGKTVAVKSLANEPIDEVVPTVGFSIVNLNYNGYNVKIYDLGGGVTIRGIWHQYFVDAHGIIFVVDSSDFSRLNEVKEILTNVLSHEKISGKPVLILANKQDNDNAIDELDLIEMLKLEELVNRQKCPTLVESCSATSLTKSSKSQIDPGIKKGFNWLMSCIIREYKILNERVIKDVDEEELVVMKKRSEIIERLKLAKQTEERKNQDDIIELYTDYANKNGNVVQPFEENISTSTSADSFKRSMPRINNTTRFDQDLIVERPRSATQIVKQQLELHHNEKRFTTMRFKNNKTQPMSFCGTSRSAQIPRGSLFNDDRRTLRSAGDSVFVIANGNSINSINHMAGGDLQQHMFHVKHKRSKDNCNVNVTGGDNSISVIDVD